MRLRITATLAFSSIASLLACEPAKDPVVPTPLGTSPDIAPSSSVAPIPTEKPATSGTLTQSPEDDLFPRVAANGYVVFQRETLDSETGNAAVMGGRLGAGAWLEQPVRLSPESKVGMSPTVSPDGTKIVFISNALGPLALLKRAPDPTSPISVLLASDKAPELGEPAFSADGTQIAFTMKGPDGKRMIATINTDGTKFTPRFAGRTPAFRPDGAALVYVARADGFNHLFIRELREGATERALTTGKFDCDNPTYSPDGAEIAYASNRGFDDARAPRETFLQIFTTRPDGMDIKRITSPKVRAAAPFWAADGWVYYSLSTGGSFDLARTKPTPQ